jgi:hypothetical protein
MNTKLLMTLSALFMAAIGILLQFIPHETLRYFEASAIGITPLPLQIVGALYLGSAITNWMAKTVLIGGIYARPLAVGNFAHFLIGALALIKYAFASTGSRLVWIFAVIYLIFAVLFGIVVFTHPLKTNDTTKN